jgi:hypothetical protein
MLKFETNAVKMSSIFFDVSGRTMTKAFVHSANTTLSSTRAFIIKMLGEQGIQRKSIVSRFILNKASSQDLSAELKDDGKSVPLAALSPKRVTIKTERGNRKGVTILLNGQRTLVPGAFLITMKNGHKGIFRRVGSKRLPIKQVPGQRLRDFYTSIAGLADSSKAFARETFFKNFQRDFEFYRDKEKA